MRISGAERAGMGLVHIFCLVLVCFGLLTSGTDGPKGCRERVGALDGNVRIKKFGGFISFISFIFAFLRGFFSIFVLAWQKFLPNLCWINFDCA